MEGLVRQRVLAEHEETVGSVITAARTVARTLPDPVTDAETVAVPLAALLRERELLGEVLAMLDTGADALETVVAGDPVPAPPYLSVRSVGPVCRATLAGGRRLVIDLRVFAIERRPVRYRFAAPDPAACLRVRLR